MRLCNWKMSCSYRFNPPVSILVICLRLPKIQPLKSDHCVPHKLISGKDRQIKRKKQLFIRHWKEIEKQSKQYYADVTLEATVSKRVSHKRLWWEIKCTFLCFFFCLFFVIYSRKKAIAPFAHFCLERRFFCLFFFKRWLEKILLETLVPFRRKESSSVLAGLHNLTSGKNLSLLLAKVYSNHFVSVIILNPLLSLWRFH